MNNIENYNEKIFENIKHIDEKGNEYWYARELMVILEYKRWDKFNNVINSAMVACAKSNNIIDDHFSQVGKMVEIGSKAKRSLNDYKLSRYACYLIVLNADPNKEVVALGKTYFAVQTRQMELTEAEFNLLSEDGKRLYNRDSIRKGNYSLNQTAKKVGVKNFDKFHNADIKDCIMVKLLMISLKEKV